VSARPFWTFQTEGWYRPSRARSDHYFRPPRFPQSETYDTEAVCAAHGSGWALGIGFRPHLRNHPQKGKACRKCERLVRAELDSPDWFGHLSASADPDRNSREGD
jgi:hypothetical protein